MPVSSSRGLVSLALSSLLLAACGDSPDRAGATLAAQLSRTSVEGPAARAFYEARGWKPAWTAGQAEELEEALARAPAHGLQPAMFLKAPLPERAEERELALTRAALLYASALARGHVDPTSLGTVYTIPRPRPDLARGLAQAMEGGALSQWLDSLAPDTEEYRALSDAYQRYRSLAERTRAKPVPEGRAIRPGASDPRVPALAQALAANGYLEEGQAGAGTAYGPRLARSVRQLQSDYGLDVDGTVGADTLDALNRGPADRARRLAVGLERLRWLERRPPPTRIDVNTAAAFLDYWQDGRRADRRRVVTGEPGWETPQLQSPIFRLAAHPIWRVPDSIMEDELSGKSAAYLARNGMEWRDGRIVQLPGPKNSLGQVKFDMRNDHAIYLHDTPAKALFGQSERHRSHGCVRVEDAVGFAFLLASSQDRQGQLRDAIGTGEETFVKLDREIPVRLIYRTAFLDGEIVRLVPDIYGWDDRVAAALGLGATPPRRRPSGRLKVDIGP